MLRHTLAIIAMAGLLVERPREEWSKVYDSIGFGNGDNTTKILSYSYYDLPSYLKPCLLHLSIFEEDSIFDTKGMIWQWIGEGFVHLEKEGSLFEAGERYFNELVNRSMIQAMENRSMTEMRAGRLRRLTQRFHIHDIVFDLISQLSRDENFFTILSSKEKHASANSLTRQKKTSVPLQDSKVRRLAVRNQHVQRFPEDTMMVQPEVLRSLNIMDSKFENMAPLHSFKVCRVLYIDRSNIPISLKHLGRLLHLKNLLISDIIVDELPNEIGRLKSLEILVLQRIGLEELPPAVCLLTRLMSLRALGFRRFPAERMGNLTSLEEIRLESVVGRNATEHLVVALGKLTKLRVVIITFSEKLEDNLQKGLVQSLSNLWELQELVLHSKRSSQQGTTVWEHWKAPRHLRRLFIQGIILSQLPGWINRSNVPHLLFLSLCVYVVKEQNLDNLAKLTELSYLELDCFSFSWPSVYTVGADSFRSLRFCKVGTALKFQMGAMPRLEELQSVVFAGYWSSWQVNGVALEQLPTKEVIQDLELGLDNLLSLEQVTVEVDCKGATSAEVHEVEAMVKRAVENHPNGPTIKMVRIVILSEECRVALLQHDIEAFISKLRMYQHIQKAIISIDCAGASMCQVEKVEAALRFAAKVLLNHPTIQLIRTSTDKMISPPDHPETELDDDHDDFSLQTLAQGLITLVGRRS